MAEIKVPTKVTGPDEITVPLVRGDYIGMSNTFRILFEVFLAIGSALLGVVLSIQHATTVHYVFLVFVWITDLVFLRLTVTHLRKASSSAGT